MFACVLVSAAFMPTAEAGAKRKPSVLVVHTETNASWVADVQSKLNSSAQFSTVASFNANTGTPTLAQLVPYDAVLLFSDLGFANATALGNNLADYVDAGGGVVNMTFSTAATTPPAGRWNPGYLSMATGAGFTTGASTLDLASITNENHPILIGVGSFSGGSSSYRANQNSVVAGATIVAKWAGGNILVSAGPRPGRADLNFFPPSNSVRADFWDASTDGVKLMVNALLYTMRPKVMLVHADNAPWAADVQSKLKATGSFSRVDLFDATVATPTLAQLQAYDAIMTWSDLDYNNATAIGNVLADYVDAGGGVVVAAVANTSTIVTCRPGGRWITGGYEIIPGSSGILIGTASLGAVAYSGHPIMSGVGSFNGGSVSLRPATTALNSGGLVVAKWSDGKTLAAVSTKMANRADLGMFPPSNAVDPGFWIDGYPGDRLMANALLYTIKPYVVVAAADSTFQGEVVGKLAATRRFSGVDNILANVATPSLATLSPYNAVATWSDFFYDNPIAMGNTLADYVDAGGGVVSAIFGITSYNSPQGRWVTQGYEITPSPLQPFLDSGPQFLGTILEPTHPIASFVRRFDGGVKSFRQSDVPLLRGRTIMNWSDGKMLASVHNSKKRADLGYWPVSSALTTGWNQRTDGTWMTANALEFVVRVKPCPGDFNGDGQVDDTDFVLFAGYYDTLTDPRGDLTGDGNAEDADFVIFANSYDTLTCP